MRFTWTAICACVLCCTGCATLRVPQSDELCGEMVKFGNSVEVGSVESVRLLTSWGSGLNGEDDVLAEKSCLHNDYAAGRNLCEYLVKHTSAEFMGINISRALSCLDGVTSRRPDASYYVEQLQGKVESLEAPGLDAGVRINLEFSTGTREAHPYLLISAKRWPE